MDHLGSEKSSLPRMHWTFLGAPPYTWLSAKGRDLSQLKIRTRILYFLLKQEPFSFQNHSSLCVFRPWLKVLLYSESHSSHSSDRPQHLLWLSTTESSSCSVVCRVLRVFYFLTLKCVPIAQSLFIIHGAGEAWRNASTAPCMPGLKVAVWYWQ